MIGGRVGIGGTTLSKQKRPGGDISDLKARLGLKKPKASKQHPRGIVRPPGAPLPPPPGAPQPSSQSGPQATDDPFGAMNAMAAQQAVSRAAQGPEFVVVNESDPVEEVSGSAKVVGFAKMAAIVLVPLIIGVVIGKIFEGRARYNQTIEDSGKLSEDVKGIRQSLVSVNNAFLSAKQDGGLKVNDLELLKSLQGLKLRTPDRSLAYRANLRTLDIDLVTNIYDFYQRASNLSKTLQDHIDETKRDSDQLKRLAANRAKVKPDPKTNPYTPYNYGVYVQIPASGDEAKKPFGAKVVQLGLPLCQDEKPAPNGICPGPPKGFRYRLQGTGGWGTKWLATPDEGKVAKDNLLILQPTRLFETLLKESKPALAELYYFRRVRALAKETAELIELGSSIESQLKAKAKEPTRFAL